MINVQYLSEKKPPTEDFMRTYKYLVSFTGSAIKRCTEDERLKGRLEFIHDYLLSLDFKTDWTTIKALNDPYATSYLKGIDFIGRNEGETGIRHKDIIFRTIRFIRYLNKLKYGDQFEELHSLERGRKL